MCRKSCLLQLVFCFFFPLFSDKPPTYEAPTLIPSFLEHPQSAFIVRNQDVTLSCKAQPVMQMFFKCNGDWMAPERHHHLETYEEFETNQMIYITICKYENGVTELIATNREE